MFALLVSWAFSEVFLGIDLGSQFVKTARSTPSGYEMVSFPTTGIFTPSAIALKSAHRLTFPLEDSDLKSATVRYGADALSVLRRYPD
jgi:hypothetical protein